MKKNRRNLRFQDAEYLLTQQYKSPKNLEARISLHENFSTSPINIHRWLFDLALKQLPPAAKILELGCGQARLWSKNSERVPDLWSLTLTDFSKGMVESSAQNLSGLFEGRKKFEVVDAQSIPYQDSSFDAVFAHFMLYHVPYREKAYREIRRVLKPAGMLFAGVLGENHLKEIYEMSMKLEETPSENWELPFRMDNGAAELEAYFEEVELLDFEDSLLVTEEQPLVDYALSMIRSKSIGDEKIALLRNEIRERLERDKVIKIGKESGCFCARKGVNDD